MLIRTNIQLTGRNGLSVDSIVRAALLKQMMGLSYDELSFYLADSLSYRSFARIEGSPSKSGLQSCISLIDAQTWEEINHLILADAAREGIEKGRMVRIDSTVTETHIHPPTDSALLWDCVRVMVRQLTSLREAFTPGGFNFRNHSRSAKRKMRHIEFTRGANKTKLYKELLKLTRQTKSDLMVGLLLTQGVQQSSLPTVFAAGDRSLNNPD